MRITTELQYSQFANNIDAAQQRLFTAQQQETTGLRINQASDDPAGTIQVLNLDGVQSQITQYQSNLSTAKTFLGLTDNALSSVNATLQSAQQIGLQAANSTTDPQAMQSLASQVAQLQQQLLSIANQQGPNGEYLFAGQKTDSVPFTVSNGSITYHGDGNSINTPVGPNATIASNIPGSPIFTNAYQALQSLQADLQSGNASSISNNDLAALQSAMSAMSLAQGAVGSRSQEVASLTNDNTRRQEELTTQLSNIQNVDVAQAATNYTEAQTAYQAALSMISRASSLSLSSFLSTTNA